MYGYRSSDSSCVECSTLSSTNCSMICTKYYFFGVNSSCVPCSNLDPYCLTCNSSFCLSCSAGFSPDSSFTTECLIDLCKIRNCKSCLSNSSCSICKTGYIPDTNGVLCSLASCSISNCLYCTSNSSCVTCLKGY